MSFFRPFSRSRKKYLIFILIVFIIGKTPLDRTARKIALTEEHIVIPVFTGGKAYIKDYLI